MRRARERHPHHRQEPSDAPRASTIRAKKNTCFPGRLTYRAALLAEFTGETVQNLIWETSAPLFNLYEHARLCRDGMICIRPSLLDEAIEKASASSDGLYK